MNLVQTNNLSDIFTLLKDLQPELLTQLIISYEIGYLGKETMESLVDDCKSISVMLTRLIKARGE